MFLLYCTLYFYILIYSASNGCKCVSVNSVQSIEGTFKRVKLLVAFWSVGREYCWSFIFLAQLFHSYAFFVHLKCTKFNLSVFLMSKCLKLLSTADIDTRNAYICIRLGLSGDKRQCEDLDRVCGLCRHRDVIILLPASEILCCRRQTKFALVRRRLPQPRELINPFIRAEVVTPADRFANSVGRQAAEGAA